jgi:regulator of RNase E activity RraA/CMP-N-acetylneuraminic acid synthetase
MNIVAFVPAKGHSERVPGKNLAVLDGEHLFKRKLRQALDCPAISEVCLDTESDEIADLASDLKVSRLVRPDALASNATDGHEMFAWECSQRTDADLWLQLLCTAPFVSATTIARAIDALLADPEADSLVGVSRAKQYCWDGAVPAYGTGRIPNSVDLTATVVEAMSLYIVRRPPSGAVPTRRFGTRPILFDLDPVEQIDINRGSDLVIAETVAAGQRAAEVTRFRAMRSHLSSTVLADICKEMGIAAVLPPNLRPTSGGKLLGRAKTLELGGLGPNDAPDAWKGIYGALDSYRFVRPGDVIMVATDVPERAYFGDLNANLAIRSGAVGAVIDGTTRDTADVRALGFPVYARTSHCNDIKFEGTLRAMNRPIAMGGVPVCNDDVVFADEDGVIVVPRARWAEVEAAAWDVMSNEARIRMYAARGRDVGEILAECGAF